MCESSYATKLRQFEEFNLWPFDEIIAVAISASDARCTWQLIGDIYTIGSIKTLMNFCLESSQLLIMLPVSISKCSTQSGKLCVGSGIIIFSSEKTYLFCEFLSARRSSYRMKKKAFSHYFFSCVCEIQDNKVNVSSCNIASFVVYTKIYPIRLFTTLSTERYFEFFLCRKWMINHATAFHFHCRLILNLQWTVLIRPSIYMRFHIRIDQDPLWPYGLTKWDPIIVNAITSQTRHRESKFESNGSFCFATLDGYE